METLRDKLAGIYPPIMTPFEDQKVAYDKLAENIKKYNNTKLKGYMPLGSNGEFRSLTDEESLKILDVVYKNKSADKHLMACTQRESAFATIEFTKKAADHGLEFASVLNPHYYANKMKDANLIAYFTTIADQSPIPVLIYNSPGFSGGVEVSPEAVSILSRHENIVGMKDGTKRPMGEFVQALSDDAEFFILAGTISKFYTGLMDGGVGGVLSMANFLPEICIELHELYLKGDRKKGMAMHERICALNKKAGGAYGIPGVKGAMDLLGYFGGESRLPLLPLTEEQLAELKSNLESEGII